MIRAALTLLLSFGVTAEAQEPTRSPPYAEDVAGIYGDIQQVSAWQEVCTDEFPSTADANKRAVREWRSQYALFVQEMEERYQNMLWQEARHDPIRHKALLDHMARVHDSAMRGFKDILVRGGVDRLREQCENYPAYLKSPAMNLEVSQAEVVNRIRKVARTSWLINRSLAPISMRFP